MDEEEVKQKLMENFVQGNEQYPTLIGIDDVIIAIILAAIGALTGELIHKCLNANTSNIRKLHRLVKWSCNIAAKTPEAAQLGWSGSEIHSKFGGRLAQSVIHTRQQLTPNQMEMLRQAYPQVGNMELPPDA